MSIESLWYKNLATSRGRQMFPTPEPVLEQEMEIEQRSDGSMVYYVSEYDVERPDEPWCVDAFMCEPVKRNPSETPGE